MTRPEAGGMKNRLDAGRAIVSVPARRRYACCHIDQFAAGSARSPIGRSSVRTPKLSVTTSEFTLVTEPTGKVSGTTNQSLP